MTEWHRLDRRSLMEHLATDAARGLTSVDARRRLAEHGPNELQEQRGRSPAAILWSQVTGTMVLLLIAAAIVRSTSTCR